MKAPLVALAIVLGTHSAFAATARPVLPFIEDDYAKAVAEARAKKLPLFIDAWAPW